MSRVKFDKTIGKIVDQPKTDSKRGGDGVNDAGVRGLPHLESYPADNILNCNGSAR